MALMFTSHAGAEFVIVPASRDNVLYENSEGALSNGEGEFLFVGRNNQVQNSKRRSVVRFDVAAHLPPSAWVAGAELALYLDKTSSSLTEMASLHRVLRDWGEGASRTPGGGGGGDSAEVNDATWLHTYYDTAFWAAPGGDFSPTSSASVAVDTSRGFKIFTSQTLADDVARFYSHPDSNFGWILVGNEAQSGSVRKFVSHDHPDTLLRPVLRLYVVGQCAVARTGDVNGDYTITAADIMDLVNFVFRAGSLPQPCPAAGDVNCSGHLTGGDIIYLVNTVFRSGQAPCDACTLVPVPWNCP